MMRAVCKSSKKRFYYGVLYFFISLFSSVCCTASDIYSFASSTERLRFQHIVQELRCLVCQNQTLEDSNALLAKDLRTLIYKKIKQGESEKAIKNYLIDRYGEFIVLKPVFSPLTYFLWLGPFILLASIIIIMTIRINKAGSATIHISE